jgi:hypothetical protein
MPLVSTLMNQTEEISVGPIWPLKVDLIQSKEIISPKAEGYYYTAFTWCLPFGENTIANNQFIVALLFMLNDEVIYYSRRARKTNIIWKLIYSRMAQPWSKNQKVEEQMLFCRRCLFISVLWRPMCIADRRPLYPMCIFLEVYCVAPTVDRVNEEAKSLFLSSFLGPTPSPLSAVTVNLWLATFAFTYSFSYCVSW